MLYHVIAHGLIHKEDVFQLGVRHTVPVFLLKVQGRLADIDAGAVDQNVDATELLIHLCHKILNSGEGSYIQLHGDTDPAGLLADFLGGGLQSLQTAAGNHNGSAGVCKANRHTAAQTAATAYHNSDLSGQIKEIFHIGTTCLSHCTEGDRIFCLSALFYTGRNVTPSIKIGPLNSIIAIV